MGNSQFELDKTLVDHLTKKIILSESKNLKSKEKNEAQPPK